jgi:hypothetical protein
MDETGTLKKIVGHLPVCPPLERHFPPAGPSRMTAQTDTSKLIVAKISQRSCNKHRICCGKVYQGLRSISWQSFNYGSERKVIAAIMHGCRRHSASARTRRRRGVEEGNRAVRRPGRSPALRDTRLGRPLRQGRQYLGSRRKEMLLRPMTSQWLIG